MVEFLPSQRKGNWRLYFDWVPREAVFSLCLPPWGWNDLAGMLVSAKNRNLTGWRGWKSTFSHFLGETCTCPADNWYHSAVVCQASLRVEIPGILLFCGIVQLFPCLRREQQTLPGVQSFMSHSGTSSSQISWATAFFTKKYLVQAAFEAGNYLKQILSEESSLCPVEASSGCIPPQQDLSFPRQRISKFIFLTSLIDWVSSHLVWISQCWTHQLLRWERWGESPSRALWSWNALRRSGRGWFFTVLLLCKAQRPLCPSVLSFALLFCLKTSEV